MTSRRRWLIVAIGVLLLACAPYAAARIPVGNSAVSAATLLTRINASADVTYSGYAEANGGLSLPSISPFSSVADLLGGTTDLRVWWRGGKDWRADAITLTGETDVHRDSTGIWSWDYERNRAIRYDLTTSSSARLPSSDDLVPSALARRLLSAATANEVTRLPAQRIAGHNVAGLELRPAETGSTIKRVDVWAVPSTGLAVKVEVFGSSASPVLTTAMLDLTTSTPSASDTAFTPPAGVDVEHDEDTDIVSFLNSRVHADPPSTLAGLPRTADTQGSVGVYGRGVTALIAVPLPGRYAYYVQREIGSTGDGAYTIADGPLQLRLTAPGDNGSRWLLAGTVTASTLATAEKQLPSVQDFFR